jgi:HD-GYP domain-containing protein (c-di-GMP phosphodiesterase class II)
VRDIRGPVHPSRGGSAEVVKALSREADTQRVSFQPARIGVPPAALDAHDDDEALVEERRARASAPLARLDSVVTSASALLFIAASASLLLLSSGGRHASLWVIVLLVVAYAVASTVEFEVGIGSAIPTQLVFVPMLFILPPAMVPLCVAVGLLLGSVGDYLRRREHPERALVIVASSWHAVGGALIMAVAGEPAASWSAWPVLLGAVLAQFAFDFCGSAARAWFAFGVPPRAHVRLMLWVYGVDVALTPIALLTAIVAAHQPLAVVAVLPLLALLAYLAKERRRRIDHALELGQAYRGTPFLLGDVIEADDEYTGTHSRDVVELTLAVADRLGLSHRDRRSAELTALLHDVGKIRIPAEIINKPGALTDDERAIINTHTVEGERMLERVGGILGEVGRLVRSCHERWDGGGYPDGLAGEQTPLVARIVCCCDAYNAMTTDRPYRAALATEIALAELESNAGSQFDPRVVAALVEIAHAEN